MAKTNSRRRKKTDTDNKIRLMFILGAVLILVGITAFLLLPGSQNTAAPQADSLSTIPVEVNYPAPELSLQNVNGKTESLKDYRSKVVLVNNWAIWCPPCKAEIPTLEAYYKDHSADGFVIIGIEAGETQADVLAFAQGHDMTYPVWFDVKNAALAAFKNQGLPSSYVIDHKSTIRLAWIGGISREMLEKYVTPLLKDN
jgi:cytochrome c biogenesis protein CcmG/thiol:disulfide interchange protein DsbE